MNHFIKRLSKLIVISLSIGIASIANATIKLSLIDGKKFTDFEVSNQSRTKSLKTVERDLNKLFAKISSEYVADNETMEVDITNIDLPGYFHYAYGSQHQDIRIVDSNTPFKLYFSYRIKNSDGQLVKEGEHKIREFSDSSIATRQHHNHGTVGYYERPLKKWFQNNFTQ
jgi:hypothetical protein